MIVFRLLASGTMSRWPSLFLTIMARLTNPLLSLGASGRVGNGPVYSSTRGIAYAREYAIPSDPKTQAQLYRRRIFSFLQNAWKNLSSSDKDSWSKLATQNKLGKFQAFMQFNMNKWTHFEMPYRIPILNTHHSPTEPTSLYVYPGVRFFHAFLSGFSSGYDWAFLFFLGSSSSFTPSPDNFLTMSLTTASGTSCFSSGFISPGSYYLKARYLSLDSVLSTVKTSLAFTVF
jgi:hypothetical protein